MNTITDAAIDTARLVATEAAEALATAERGTDDEALAQALLLERRSASRLRELEAQQIRQRADLTARATREAAAAPELDRIGDELEASRKQLVAQLGKAQAAMVDALRATAQHDELVSKAREILLGHGLADDGLDEYANAAGQGRGAVKVRGATWLPVRASDVLAGTAHSLALAMLGRGAFLTSRLAKQPGVADLSRRADGLLAGLPVLREAEVPARMAIPAQVREYAEANPGPSLLRPSMPAPDPNWRENLAAMFPGNEAQES